MKLWKSVWVVFVIFICFWKNVSDSLNQVDDNKVNWICVLMFLGWKNCFSAAESKPKANLGKLLKNIMKPEIFHHQKCLTVSTNYYSKQLNPQNLNNCNGDQKSCTEATCLWSTDLILLNCNDTEIWIVRTLESWDVVEVWQGRRERASAGSADRLNTGRQCRCVQSALTRRPSLCLQPSATQQLSEWKYTHTHTPNKWPDMTEQCSYGQHWVMDLTI